MPKYLHPCPQVMPLLLSLLLSVPYLSGCARVKDEPLMLATTTSTEQTGLLADLLPLFTEETGIRVDVIAVGTGQALELGRKGEADLLLVHDTVSEEAFVHDGYAPARHNVMYNRFVLVGPPEDPAEIAIHAPADMKEAFKRVWDAHALFLSRGDASGTHQRELSLWKESNREPTGTWYLSTGKGMGEVLQMADEMRAYTLTDEGTWLTMARRLELNVLVSDDPRMQNQYGVLVVNRPEGKSDRLADAKRLAAWFLSDMAQKRIGEFGRAAYGQALFVPNAN